MGSAVDDIDTKKINTPMNLGYSRAFSRTTLCILSPSNFGPSFLFRKMTAYFYVVSNGVDNKGTVIILMIFP